MISLHTNLSSIITQQSLKTSTNKLNQAIERMSTGYKINHAGDNAANYSISTNMTTQLNSYEVAQDNIAMGIDMVSTANGALDEIYSRASRLQELYIQASNGTYDEDSISAMTREAEAIVAEINRIYCNTEYSGRKLLEVQTIDPEVTNRPTVNESGFIQDITRLDTSSVTTLASVDEDVSLESGTYSIATAEELQKLATMTNNGKIGTNTEFVLANDIDLSGIDNFTTIGYCYINEAGTLKGTSFKGNFDGNGYVVKNLKVANESGSAGLFGYTTQTVTIKNLGVENVDIYAGDQYAAGIVAYGVTTNIKNCYTTGEIRGANIYNGGIVGRHQSGTITDCYSKSDVYGGCAAGGIAGATSSKTISNCFYEGNIYAMLSTNCGGIVGTTYNNTVIEGCYVDIKNKNNGGIFVGYTNPSNTKTVNINNCSYSTVYSDMKLIGNPKDSVTITYNNLESYSKEIIKTNLQVGINSDDSSRIEFDTSFDCSAVNVLAFLNGGHTLFSKYSAKYYKGRLDVLIDKITNKQTELGAVQNRLESALESTSVNIENLTSSRSTLRDADIAKESSKFIQQQILQQAAATLMSTANQSPAIALQLI